LGFEFSENQAESQYNRIKSLVNEELKVLPSEFLNRLDEIIVFRQLNKDEVKEIAAIMLKEVFGRLNEQGITLEVTERFRSLGGRGLQPQLRRHHYVGQLCACWKIARRVRFTVASRMATAVVDVDDAGGESAFPRAKAVVASNS